MDVKQEVVAAIPNYNMGSSLSVLLPEVLKQGYDQVIVLDDASSDDSGEIVRSFGNEVTLVAGKKNVGSGANRNRILEVLPSDSQAIIHFLDADITLDSQNTPDLVRTVFKDPKIKAAGGLVKNRDNLQMIWNWGQRFNLRTYAGVLVARRVEKMLVGNPDKASKFMDRWRFVACNTPDPFSEPVAKDVFWVSEANMMIRAKDFREIGGFDNDLRVHDVFAIAMKLRQRGQNFRFDPSIVVTHKAIDVRGPGREKEESKAMRYLFKKYGLKLFY